jgi:hypothetical protein
MKNLPAIYKLLKKTSFSNENVLVLPEFLKNNTLLMENPLKMSEFPYEDLLLKPKN